MTKGVMEFFKTPAGFVLLGASLATGGTLGVPKLIGAFSGIEVHSSADSKTEARLQALEHQVAAMRTEQNAMRSEQNAKLQRVEDRLDKLIDRPYASRVPR